MYIQTELVDYVVRLIGATRSHPSILRGASPRATLSVTAMAKSIAFLNGRDYVIPSDVQTVFCDTVAHRLLLEPGCGGSGSHGAGDPGGDPEGGGSAPGVLTMLRNRLIYLAALVGGSVFYLFFYAWFSWFLLVILWSLPVLSLWQACRRCSPWSCPWSLRGTLAVGSRRSFGSRRCAACPSPGAAFASE